LQLQNKILFLSMLAISTMAESSTITAKSFMVTDINGNTIIEKNANDVRSIASITKLMTVMVVLDANQPLDELLTIDVRQRRKYQTHLPPMVKKLTRQTLIELALVKSDNLAAYILCEYYPGGVNDCVNAMNSKANQLYLQHTHYTDPTGLDPDNVSTARDLAQLVLVARYYPQILNASGMATVDLKVKEKWWHFGNTNPLVRKNTNIRVSKTGFINRSGGCVIMLLDTEAGQRVIVLLGS
jgi:D-alanyl-D-alanine endopeptidase (penicillin-binding protein 7)